MADQSEVPQGTAEPIEPARGGSERKFVHGHFTMADGSRVPMTEAQANDLWAQVEAERKHRETTMPDEKAAIKAMSDANQRLKDFGWRDIIYCPKDGSIFDAIECGSTGIHDCQYLGEWPNGSWWVLWDGDMGPSNPVLFRLKPEATQRGDSDTCSTPRHAAQKDKP